MQYLDPVLLRTRLFESLFYLHSQPPLFNLFLGIVLKLYPQNPAPLFQAVYLLLGVTLTCAVLLLQLRLGVSRPVAVALALLFATSPSLLLYSNWLFYSLPVAVLLCLATLFLHGFVSTCRGRYGCGFFFILAVVCLTRSSFHLVYFLAVAVGVALLVPGLRRRTLATALVPLLLVTAVYAKNLAVFGRFSASSWLGMNLWEVVSDQLPQGEIEHLVEAGKLSAAALVPRYSDVAAYPAAYREPSRHNVPALTQPVKSTDVANYNNITYARVSDAYLRDAAYLILHRPAGFAKGLLKSWFAYFKSSTDYVLLEPNRTRIGFWNRSYDAVFYGRIPFDLSRTGILKTTSPRGHFPYLFLFIGLPVLFVFGARLALTRTSELDRAQRITLAFILFTIIYSALVGNLLEAGENNRFRFETDPLSLVLLGLALTHLLRRPRA